jgi:hypothetical protein
MFTRISDDAGRRITAAVRSYEARERSQAERFWSRAVPQGPPLKRFELSETPYDSTNGLWSQALAWPVLYDKDQAKFVADKGTAEKDTRFTVYDLSKRGGHGPLELDPSDPDYGDPDKTRGSWGLAYHAWDIPDAGMQYWETVWIEGTRQVIQFHWPSLRHEYPSGAGDWEFWYGNYGAIRWGHSIGATEAAIGLENLFSTMSVATDPCIRCHRSGLWLVEWRFCVGGCPPWGDDTKPRDNTAVTTSNTGSPPHNHTVYIWDGVLYSLQAIGSMSCRHADGTAGAASLQLTAIVPQFAQGDGKHAASAFALVNLDDGDELRFVLTAIENAGSWSLADPAKLSIDPNATNILFEYLGPQVEER